MNAYREVLDFFVAAPSKEKARTLAKETNRDDGFLEFVIKESLQNRGKYSRYSIWIIDKLVVLNKAKVQTHLGNIISFLPSCKDQTQRGISLRIILRCKPSTELSGLGLLMDHCYEILNDKKAPQYHKSYAMQILFHICRQEAAFREEFTMTIENIYPHLTSPYMHKLADSMLSELA